MGQAQPMRNSDMANFLIDEFQKPKQNQYYNNQAYNYNSNSNDVEWYDTGNTESYNSVHNKWILDYIIGWISSLIIFIIDSVIFVLKKICYFIYLYIKTFIILSSKLLWKITTFIASLYRPSITIIDKYFTYLIKWGFDILSDLSYNSSRCMYKYWEKKKYYTFEVGKQKYSDKDIARMASGIWSHETLTLKDIEQRYHIWYATAIKVRDMRSDQLTMLQLLRETMEEESNNNNY